MKEALERKSGKIPAYRFDTSVISPADGIEARREYFRPLGDVQPALEHGPEQNSCVIGHMLHNLLITEIDTGAFVYQSGGRYSGSAPQGYVTLRTYISGSTAGLIDNQPFKMSTGNLYLFDRSVELIQYTAGAKHLNVTFQADRVGYDPAIHPPLLVINQKSPVGRILTDLLISVNRQLAETDQTDAELIADAIANLVKGAIRKDTKDDRVISQFAKSRKSSILKFVENNLTNENLNSELIMNTFNMSRATLYRIFTEHGGIANYIMKRRVERAFCDLACQPRSKGQVTRVADRWGFYDQGHFRRLLMEKYGVSPTEVMAMANEAGFESAASNMRLGSRAMVPDLDTYLRNL